MWKDWISRESIYFSKSVIFSNLSNCFNLENAKNRLSDIFNFENSLCLSHEYVRNLRYA